MSIFNIFKRNPKFIMTGDGNVTLAWNGKSYSIGKTHCSYDDIVSCLMNGQFGRLDSLINVAATVQRAVEGVIVNEFGEVSYRGEQVHGVIADKISAFVKAKLPYKPLARFLSNLMENPNATSRSELYDFLMHGNFPITHDGCFLAYKGLTHDFKDRHTGTVDNNIGSINEMPRENVDHNTDVACSSGYHVGTHGYASDFAASDGKLVLVKVNPRDAVSVPRDHSCEKLRVCRYEVVEICDAIRQEPLYVKPGIQPEEYQDDCEHCGYPDCDGYCEDANEPGAFDEDNDNEREPTVQFKKITCSPGWDQANTGRHNEKPTNFKAPKRPACTYCGAKGGKKHTNNCRRPRRK